MNIADELDKAMSNYKVGGISQPELAALSGVPQPTISRTLKGKSIPETKTLIKLAKALKCTLGGYAAPEPPSTAAYQKHNVTKLKAKEKEALPEHVAEIVALAMKMTRDGQLILLGRAHELADKYSVAKAKRSS